jgi:DNA topoisomerase-3
LPTPTGIQLIDTIQNDLVISRIDGILEKQLKDIEKEPAVLVPLSMKRMVATLVDEVRSESRQANISHAGSAPKEVSK